MNNVQVKVSPPDVCYLYPPYHRKSSTLFTVRARSRSVPVAYKVMCFKNRDMDVFVEERIDYNHIPADRGVIKTGKCKVFKVTLGPGYDPIENRDDGFNVLLVLTSASLASVDPEGWWTDGDLQVSKVDFLMMSPTGGRCLPEELVVHPDPSRPHPGRVISGHDETCSKGEAKGEAQALPQPDVVPISTKTVEKRAEKDATPPPEKPKGQSKDYDPEAEIRLLEELMNSLKAEQGRVDRLFQSAFGVLDRAEKFHKGKK